MSSEEGLAQSRYTGGGVGGGRCASWVDSSEGRPTDKASQPGSAPSLAAQVTTGHPVGQHLLPPTAAGGDSVQSLTGEEKPSLY